MILHAVVGVVSALGGASAQFTTLFGQGEGARIAASVSLAGVVLSALGIALGAGSSTEPGPLATPDKKD